MKKVAIQLFGHLRSYKNTYESLFRNVVQPQVIRGYDVDVFIHTWDETDHATVTWHNTKGEQRGRGVTSDIVDEVRKLYQPKSMLMESQLDVSDDIIIEKIAGISRSFKGFVNAAYTEYMGSKIRRDYAAENAIHYDWVIVTRPDIFFYSPFIVDDFLKVYGEYHWDIPKNGVFFAYNPFARGLVEDKYMIGGSDLCFFGNEKTIDIATSCYDDIQANTVNPDTVKDNFYCFEIFWYEYWEKHGLEPIRIKYLQGSDYQIIRNAEDYNSVIRNKKKPQDKYLQSRLLRLEQELLKLLPYCLVRSRIARIQRKIEALR